ncbi:MAG: protein kinase [Chlamydiales bacterium]|nr:protein kinase [Chlamydiales bacterium]
MESIHPNQFSPIPFGSTILGLGDLLLALIEQVKRFVADFGQLFESKEVEPLMLTPDNREVDPRIARLLREQGIDHFDAKLGEGSFGKVYSTEVNGKTKAVKLEKERGKREGYSYDSTHGEGSGLGLPKKHYLQVTEGVLLQVGEETLYVKSKDELSHYHGREDVKEVGSLSRARDSKNLADWIIAKRTLSTGLSSDQTREFAWQLANAITTFHRVTGKAHNDIKPENILLKHKNSFQGKKTEIRLGDHGLSQNMGSSFGGSPAYRAPENTCSEASDWYSFGKTLYTIATGKNPKNPNLNLSPITNTPFLKDLLEKLLEEDPTKRLSSEQILNHPYFKGMKEEVRYEKEEPEVRVSEVPKTPPPVKPFIQRWFGKLYTFVDIQKKPVIHPEVAKVVTAHIPEITHITQRKVAKGGMGEIYFACGQGEKGWAIKLEKKPDQIFLGYNEINGLGLQKNSHLQRSRGVIVRDAQERYHFIQNPKSLETLIRAGAVLFLVGTVSRLRSEGTLLDLVGQSFGINRLTPVTTKHLAFQLATAIHAFHTQKPGTVHNDVKPANVLIKEKNGEYEVKLGDFGHSSPSGKTQNGTLFYEAPERIKTQKSDWYSFGMTLYTMVTGLEGEINLNHPKILEDQKLHDLLTKLTQKESDRLDGASVLTHPYFDTL